MAALVLVENIKNGIIYEDGYFLLKNVRLSYPHLARPYKGKDDDPKKKGAYGVVAMLEEGKKHGELIEVLQDYITDLLKKNGAGKVSADRRFLRDGNEDANADYEDHWIASVRETKRPSVRDADGDVMDPVDDEERIEEMIYGGCYGNVLIRVWYQDGVKVGKGYGKRVNAGLVGVKFVEDGDPFGEGRIDDAAAWGDDDDKPSRAKRRSSAEDDDDKPARRRAAKDDDDDDKPARRRAAKDDDDDDKPVRRRAAVSDDNDDL